MRQFIVGITLGLGLLVTAGAGPASALMAAPDAYVRCTEGVQGELPTMCDDIVCEGYTQSLRGIDVDLNAFAALFTRYTQTVDDFYTVPPTDIEVWPEVVYWNGKWSHWSWGDRFQIYDSTTIFNVSKNRDACHRQLTWAAPNQLFDWCEQSPVSVWLHLPISDGHFYRVKLWYRPVSCEGGGCHYTTDTWLLPDTGYFHGDMSDVVNGFFNIPVEDGISSPVWVEDYGWYCDFR